MSDYQSVSINLDVPAPTRIEQLVQLGNSNDRHIAETAKAELYTRTIALRDFLAIEEANDAKKAATDASLAKTYEGMGHTVNPTPVRQAPDLTGVQPFASREQMAKAMSHPDYRMDEAYRADVMKRVMVSPF